MARINKAPKLTFKENFSVTGCLDIFLKNQLIGVIYSTTQENWCYNFKLDELDGDYQGHGNMNADEAKRVVKAIYETYVATNGFKNLQF